MEAEIRQKRKNKPYTINKVEGKEIWYVHHKGFSYIPVFGSFGTKAEAQKICRMYNKSVGR